MLCDYKTDYIPKEIIGNELEIARFLFDRHGEQLSYYAKAVQKLLSHRPDMVCVYSLFLGKEFDLDI